MDLDEIEPRTVQPHGYARPRAGEVLSFTRDPSSFGGRLSPEGGDSAPPASIDASHTTLSRGSLAAGSLPSQQEHSSPPEAPSVARRSALKDYIMRLRAAAAEGTPSHTSAVLPPDAHTSPTVMPSKQGNVASESVTSTPRAPFQPMDPRRSPVLQKDAPPGFLQDFARLNAKADEVIARSEQALRELSVAREYGYGLAAGNLLDSTRAASLRSQGASAPAVPHTAFSAINRQSPAADSAPAVDTSVRWIPLEPRFPEPEAPPMRSKPTVIASPGGPTRPAERARREHQKQFESRDHDDQREAAGPGAHQQTNQLHTGKAVVSEHAGPGLQRTSEEAERPFATSLLLTFPPGLAADQFASDENDDVLRFLRAREEYLVAQLRLVEDLIADDLKAVGELPG
eukprot:m.257422 g.257422  ORF g.257422 m.257422 type:complete len:400 (-) comp20821_c0_seq1:3287-4486(-)